MRQQRLLDGYAAPLTLSLGGEAEDEGRVLQIVSASGAEGWRKWAFESQGVSKRIASRLSGVEADRRRHFEK